MLTDVEGWLVTTGYAVAPVRFKKPPTNQSYITFLERRDVRGADSRNSIAERSITVELYAEAIDPAAEAAIEALLDARAVEYAKDRQWIDSERYFQTVYDFDLIEKI